MHVGGSRLVCMEMRTPNGPMQMWFTGEYREVVENKRLVYTESMSDANGNVLSPADLGMPAGHPPTTEIRVELQDVSGHTRMVMTHTGIPADSPGGSRMGDGARQARRPHRRTWEPIAPGWWTASGALTALVGLPVAERKPSWCKVASW